MRFPSIEPTQPRMLSSVQYRWSDRLVDIRPCQKERAGRRRRRGRRAILKWTRQSTIWMKLIDNKKNIKPRKICWFTSHKELELEFQDSRWSCYRRGYSYLARFRGQLHMTEANLASSACCLEDLGCVGIASDYSEHELSVFLFSSHLQPYPGRLPQHTLEKTGASSLPLPPWETRSVQAKAEELHCGTEVMHTKWVPRGERPISVVGATGQAFQWLTGFSEFF